MMLPLGFRLALASFLFVPMIVIGSLELGGYRASLLQCSRETPRHWLNSSRLSWALTNGLALGFGATSRIGFWLWYVIPLGALLFANPMLGAIIYGSYSTVRGAAVWSLILIGPRLLGDDYAEWLVRHKDASRKVSAFLLVLLGTTSILVVGL